MLLTEQCNNLAACRHAKRNREKETSQTKNKEVWKNHLWNWTKGLWENFVHRFCNDGKCTLINYWIINSRKKWWLYNFMVLQSPIIKEVERLKNNKATGANSIFAKLIKICRVNFRQSCYELIGQLCDLMPGCCRKSICVHKKKNCWVQPIRYCLFPPTTGGPKCCNHNRQISRGRLHSLQFGVGESNP